MSAQDPLGCDGEACGCSNSTQSFKSGPNSPKRPLCCQLNSVAPKPTVVQPCSQPVSSPGQPLSGNPSPTMCSHRISSEALKCDPEVAASSSILRCHFQLLFPCCLYHMLSLFLPRSLCPLSHLRWLDSTASGLSFTRLPPTMNGASSPGFHQTNPCGSPDTETHFSDDTCELAAEWLSHQQMYQPHGKPSSELLGGHWRQFCLYFAVLSIERRASRMLNKHSAQVFLSLFEVFLTEMSRLALNYSVILILLLQPHKPLR